MSFLKTLSFSLTKRRIALLFSALVLLAGLFMAVFETRAPYYFMQDDNRAQLLPFQIHNYTSLARDGEIAQFNFHQSLGIPANGGAAGVLYPPVLASLWLSQKIFGHFWAAADLLAPFHIVLAGGGAFFLASALGMELLPAFFVAFSWAFCPVVIFSGASWWHSLCTAAWFPWLLYGILRLYALRDGMAVFIITLASAALMYEGHPQFALYASVFAALLGLGLLFLDPEQVSYSAGKMPDNSGKKNVLSYLRGRGARFVLFACMAVGAGWLLAMPVLQPLIDAMHESILRSKPLNYSEFSARNLPWLTWFTGLVWPFSADGEFMENAFRLDKQAFLGYVPLGLLLFSFIKVRDIGWRMFTLIAGLAAFGLLWATGCFNQLEYFVPYFNHLRWHFKLIPYLNLLLLLLAGFGASYLWRRGLKKTVWTLAAVHLAFLFCFYAFGPRMVFRLYEEKMPAAPETRYTEFSHARVVGVEWPDNGSVFMPGLLADYATVSGLYGFAGYDVLMPFANSSATFGLNYGSAIKLLDKDMLSAMRSWGVRWYIAPVTLNSNKQFMENHGLRLAHNDGNRLVYEDPKAAPLVADASGAAVPDWHAHGNHFEAHGLTGGCYRLNWLYRSGFFAVSDLGRNIAVTQTPDERLGVCLAQGETGFDLSWHSRRLKAGFIYCFAGVLILALMLVFLRAGNRPHGDDL